MGNNELTQKEYWDGRWSRIKLPVIVQQENAGNVVGEMLTIIEKLIPKKEGLTILEIGGAPGSWLAYFSKIFHYEVSAIDYSDVGCDMIRNNFRLLNLPVTLYKKNIMTDDLSGLPRFDIVFSLGFIEHFTDLDAVIEKHNALLKVGGLLMLCVPNFSGISQVVLRKTSPGLFATHNFQAMDIRNWGILEDKYNFTPLFKGYIGGFDLRHCRRCENRTLINKAIRLFFKMLTRATDRITVCRKFNSPYWSPYLLGIYRK